MTARDRVGAIFRAAIAAADPADALRHALRLDGETLHLPNGEAVDLAPLRGVWLIGAGKATPRMAQGALDVLGGHVRGGIVATKDGHALPLPGVEVWEAGHPLPDARSLAAAAETLNLVRALRGDDLLLCLLSGGASALWAAPPDGVTLGELQAVTDALLRAGAPIGEVNRVRRHLSQLAGGRLARAAAPARVVTLAVSDVLGSPPEVIGSGPTVLDPSTFADALAVLRAREVHAPPAVTRHLQAGAAGLVPDTLKPDDPVWARTSFQVIASIREALQAASREAARLGYHTTLLSGEVEGEAREVAGDVVRAALAARDGGAPRPHALLWGGETTVTVRGKGRGGRNQEMALAAALALEGQEGVVIACAATDGTDGPTDAAGGVVDGHTLARARAAGLDARAALADNDAYTLLRAAGDLLVTGPTGTNVNDLIIALVE